METNINTLLFMRSRYHNTTNVRELYIVSRSGPSHTANGCRTMNFGQVHPINSIHTPRSIAIHSASYSSLWRRWILARDCMAGLYSIYIRTNNCSAIIEIYHSTAQCLVYERLIMLSTNSNLKRQIITNKTPAFVCSNVGEISRRRSAADR